MNKLLVVQIVRLLGLCVVLLSNAIILISFLLLVSKQKEEVPMQPVQFVCGVVDYTDSTQLIGKQLFEQNCLACHNQTDETLIGPGLRGITEKRTVKWIIRWVQNPEKVLQQGDKYAVRLYKKFNQTQMTAFPELSESEIRAILSYIEGKSFAVASLGGVRATGSASPHRANSPKKAGV